MSWVCAHCTFRHDDDAGAMFLACKLCGHARVCEATKRKCEVDHGNCEGGDQVERKRSRGFVGGSADAPGGNTGGSTWGSLRPPTSRDVAPRKIRRGLDRPPQTMSHIVVLDFEWTADQGARMRPVAEITQFPSVLVDLRRNELASGGGGDVSSGSGGGGGGGSSSSSSRDRRGNQSARIVDEYDTFVRPTLNPRLSAFATELTGITQTMVDNAPSIDSVLPRYLAWLRSHALVDAAGGRVGHWSLATWGDVDVMTTLRQELAHKKIDFPPCFDKWINLKDDAVFKRHYGWRPRGGLQRCVNSIAPGSVVWEGRAHNGLVDSRNTAKIVVHMANTGYRFVRATRGMDANGVPYGLRTSRDTPEAVRSVRTFSTSTKSK